VCVGPGASCPTSDVGSNSTPSAPEAGTAATGPDAALSDAGDSPGGSCPNVELDSFDSVSDAASALAGRWVNCTANGSAYGFPPTNLVALGAPADAVGVEFAAATAGGGSCAAVAAHATACAGGLLFYLVDGPNVYESSYAVFDVVSPGGVPGLGLSFGATPTANDFRYGPRGPSANAQVLSIEANDFDFVALVAIR